MTSRLTYANVMATVAVFLALGGTSYAVTALPRNSVGTPQLKKSAVTGVKVKNGSLTRADFAAGTLLKGDTGATGAQGPQGERGERGATGATGAVNGLEADIVSTSDGTPLAYASATNALAIGSMTLGTSSRVMVFGRAVWRGNCAGATTTLKAGLYVGTGGTYTPVPDSAVILSELDIVATPELEPIEIFTMGMIDPATAAGSYDVEFRIGCQSGTYASDVTRSGAVGYIALGG